MDKDILIATAIGGIVITLMYLIPIASDAMKLIFLLSGGLIGGFAGAFYYSRKNKLTIKNGSGIGALCGVLGGLIIAVIGGIVILSNPIQMILELEKAELGGSSLPLLIIINTLLSLAIASGLGAVGGLAAGFAFGARK